MNFTLDGAAVYAATGGRDLDPALPSIVFIHGAGMDSSVWALFTRYFAHHGRNVLAFDLPGHGRSGGAPLTSIEAMADWTLRAAEAAGVKDIAFAGHSMGSLIALEAASRGSARALALLGTAAAMPVHQDLLSAAQANDHAAIDMVAIWGHGQHAGLGGSRAPGLWMIGNGLRLLERARPGVLYADMNACNSYGNGPATAAKVACPAKLVLGSRDLMTPARAGKDLAGLLAKSSVTVLEGCGHMMMSEQPDQSLDALIGAI